MASGGKCDSSRNNSSLKNFMKSKGHGSKDKVWYDVGRHARGQMLTERPNTVDIGAGERVDSLSRSQSRSKSRANSKSLR